MPFPCCTAGPVRLASARTQSAARRLRQDFRRLRHRSYITGEIDLATVHGSGSGERARAEPADVAHRNHLQLRVWPERPGVQFSTEPSMFMTGRPLSDQKSPKNSG
jgi:hypothetical protein